jgi:hypothetical protein
MFFRLYPILTTIFFIALVIFTLFFFSHPFVWWILGVGALIIYISIYLSVGRLTSTILPALLIVGSLPTISLMASAYIRYFVIAVLAVALYLQLLAKSRLKSNPADNVAVALLSGINFLVFFVWSNLIFASFINFSDTVFPDWLMLLITALVSFIVAKDTLENSLFLKIKSGELRKNDLNVGGLITAIATTETAWALTFFPFRYRSSAVILFAIFYLAFTSTQFFLTKEEKSRKLAKDIVLVVVAVAIILLTSKWRYY